MPGEFPDIISGIAEGDDAAVYRVSSDLALIFTTDFFTPIVDDPYDFGAIAAANALSDIYAMGGEVVLALNIACFPKNMNETIIEQILLGGAEKVHEAGGAIAGGHTVDDEEPKYGLAVLGRIHPSKLWEKSGACPGDALVLTKPLGTGLITTALKGGLADPGHLAIAAASMKQLNRTACRIAADFRCHAATDVTGFGFIGHALEIADRSKVSLRIAYNEIQLLPGTLDYARMWLFPAGAERNRKTYHSKVGFHESISEEDRMILFNPETSGGLLMAMPEKDAAKYVNDCIEQSIASQLIGHVESGSGLRIE